MGDVRSIENGRSMAEGDLTIALGDLDASAAPVPGARETERSLPSRDRVGNKAYSLAKMANLGLRVPPAFVITTDACRAYFAAGERIPAALMAEVRRRVGDLEHSVGRTFGAGAQPLLLSVRSGAAISMPGMMDTVLNLGMSDEVEQALARESGDPAFARDTHRRFMEMFARIVLKATLPELPPDADSATWRAMVERGSGRPFPSDPYERLELAIGAVFASFHSRRAKKYREHAGISHDIGTAVTIQAMVFGNLDARSGTGVLFSRNPLDGSPEPYGEYLPRAQGEDVVSGSRDPLPLGVLEEQLPEVHASLVAAAAKLEADARDVQDIEFTVQKGVLYFLQTRSAKRAPKAAVRLAVAFAREGRIDPAAALTRVSSEQVRSLLRPRLEAAVAERGTVLVRGEPAGPGVGRGAVVTDPDEAEQRKNAGEAVVLARATTSPEDIHGMLAAEAVITETGGSTSHAAVVSRALGRPCVVGCGPRCETLAGRTVTVDGDRGIIFEGLLPLVHPDESDDPDLRALTTWAEAASPLAVTTDLKREDAFVLPDESLEEARPALVARLRGNSCARGAVLETHEGIAAALEAGVATVVVRRRLPALLSAIEARRQSTPS